MRHRSEHARASISRRTARLRACGRKRVADDPRGRLIGRTKGGMNTKLHAVTDGEGRPIRFFMTADEVSDYTRAAALLSSLPKAKWLLADRGGAADWFRDALKDKGIKPRIPGRSSVANPSNTTSVASNDATRSRSCPAVPSTDDVWPPATTDAQKPSSQP